MTTTSWTIVSILAALAVMSFTALSAIINSGKCKRQSRLRLKALKPPELAATLIHSGEVLPISTGNAMDNADSTQEVEIQWRDTTAPTATTIYAKIA